MLNVFAWAMLALLWFNGAYSNVEKRNKNQAYVNLLAGFFCIIVFIVLLIK